MKNISTSKRNQMTVVLATVFSSMIMTFSAVNVTAAAVAPVEQTEFYGRNLVSSRSHTDSLRNQAVIEEAAGAQRQQNYRSAQENRSQRNNKVGELISMEHNGQTIYVSEHAVKTLLEYGDSLTP